MRSGKDLPPEQAPSPARVSPSHGSEALKRQVQAARALLARDSLTADELGAWQTLTQALLIRVFGSDSPSVSRVMAVGKRRAGTFGNRTEAYYDKSRKETLTTQVSYVEGLIESLRQEEKFPGPISESEKSTVFVVHGRNQLARDAMFAFLRALGLRPLEWEQAAALTGEGSPLVSHVLEKAFQEAHAFVVVLTGDEIASLRPELASEGDTELQTRAQPRPNVLFEAGMAFGFQPDRTILVEIGPLNRFSDIEGRHCVRLTNKVASRQSLLTRLKTAGCAVDANGTDWHTAGDFDGAILPPLAQGATAKALKVPPAPPEGEARQVLEFLMRMENAARLGETTVVEIGASLGIPLARARHRVDKLIDEGRVAGSYSPWAAPTYYLTAKGREALSELGVL